MLHRAVNRIFSNASKEGYDAKCAIVAGLEQYRIRLSPRFHTDAACLTWPPQVAVRELQPATARPGVGQPRLGQELASHGQPRPTMARPVPATGSTGGGGALAVTAVAELDAEHSRRSRMLPYLENLGSSSRPPCLVLVA
jgi:hypothetical protein